MAEGELCVLTNIQPTPSKRDRGIAASKRSRGRSGCLNCRRRRKKCDEDKPACAKCAARGESCEWDTRTIFRLSGIDTRHPSMIHSRNLKTHSDYQIMNVTFDDSTSTSQQMHRQQQDAMSQHSPSSSPEQSGWGVQESHSNHNVALFDNEETLRRMSRESGAFSTHNATMINSPPEEHTGTQTIGTSTRFHVSVGGLEDPTAVCLKDNSTDNSNDREMNIGTFSDSRSRILAAESTIGIVNLQSEIATNTGFSCLDNTFNSGASTRARSTATSLELDPLDYLTSQPNRSDFFESTLQLGKSLQCYSRSNSDILDPDFTGEITLAESPDLQTVGYSAASYQDLHTTLYNHMVETARNTALTRQTSPDPFIQEAPAIVHDASPSSSNINDIRTQIREPGLRPQPLKSVKLTQRRQLELWRNYLDEVAVWLDMFDNDRHFQFKIPLLAKSADHLHYSILALSARQMERKSPDKSYTESLGLYQEAIQLIVKELYTLDTTVIASCVLLCVLEMMSSSPRAWCRHLNGCAMLFEAAGVNGVVGGVGQSLFWCFARMDVWGGFLEDTLTQIPTSHWFVPSGSMREAVTHFKAGCGSHSYANYAVFLCASVVNVISDQTNSCVRQAEVGPVRRNTYSARWKALFDLLEDWYNNRPEEMQPLMAHPSSSSESQEPFSAVLYGSSPAVNGNQLYHAAALLMLQDKPKGIRLSRSPKSILWHARQICGIAASNSDHGARINSLQPLWIAGKIMSHESEHRAIVDLLAKIEKDTGWATAWRANDLRDYWGDAKCSEMY